MFFFWRKKKQANADGIPCGGRGWETISSSSSSILVLFSFFFKWGGGIFGILAVANQSTVSTEPGGHKRTNQERVSCPAGPLIGPTIFFWIVCRCGGGRAPVPRCSTITRRLSGRQRGFFFNRVAIFSCQKQKRVEPSERTARLSKSSVPRRCRERESAVD